MSSPPWIRGIFNVVNGGKTFHSESLNTASGANGFLVDLGVELYGAPCVNPSEHP